MGSEGLYRRLPVFYARFNTVSGLENYCFLPILWQLFLSVAWLDERKVENKHQKKKQLDRICSRQCQGNEHTGTAMRLSAIEDSAETGIDCYHSARLQLYQHPFIYLSFVIPFSLLQVGLILYQGQTIIVIYTYLMRILYLCCMCHHIWRIGELRTESSKALEEREQLDQNLQQRVSRK